MLWLKLNLIHEIGASSLEWSKCEAKSHEIMPYLGGYLNILKPKQDDCHFAGDISKLIFLNEKFLYLDSSLIQVCAFGSNLKKIIGLSNGLAPNRQQAIFWTNGGLVH